MKTRTSEHYLVPAGPSARRLARELGIDISKVTGSGKRGRIVREDIKHYAKSLLAETQKHNSAHRFPSEEELPDLSRYGSIQSQDMSTLEKATARNMQRSWNQIPHAWVQQSIDITELEAGRQRMKSDYPALTLTAFLIKAISICLRKHPKFNTAFDQNTLQIIYRQYIHIGVAVDTPRGLVVVVLKHADDMSIADIGDKLQQLSRSAYENKLHASDMQGSGMTLSNLGGMGVSGLQPLINWPEVAILGTAQSAQQAIYVDGVFQPRLMLPVTLGFDHRVINGADSARFLQHLNTLLSDPFNFLLQH